MKHLAAALLALAACTAESPPPEGEQVTSFVEQKLVPLYYNAQIDLLFVIDSSPAMAGAQQKLVAEYRAMIESLSTNGPAGLPDVHIGVTTADAVDQGRLRRGDFLADTPRFAWRREASYEGPLADAFVDRASVGAAGHALVEPFDAALRALSPSVNPGFVRADAQLYVVFLTAGDDQSATPVADVARALKMMKSDPAKVTVAGAFGACATDAFTATAAPRLAALFDEFPNRNVRTTLCEDLTPLVRLRFSTSLGLPCMESVLVQPFECNAWLADPDSDETYLLPACSAANPDRCWELRPNPQACTSGDGLSLHTKPAVTPFSAMLNFECVAEPN